MADRARDNRGRWTSPCGGKGAVLSVAAPSFCKISCSPCVLSFFLCLHVLSELSFYIVLPYPLTACIYVCYFCIQHIFNFQGHMMRSPTPHPPYTRCISSIQIDWEKNCKLVSPLPKKSIVRSEFTSKNMAQRPGCVRWNPQERLSSKIDDRTPDQKDACFSVTTPFGI